MTDGFTSPYRLAEPPTSPGKALLSRAFEHWCALHFGMSPLEVEACLLGARRSDPEDRRQVRSAARLLGEVMCLGEMRAFARPIGAGSPIPLPTSVWERDDFTRLFASSALDPGRPFDDEAAPTHWIFVDVAAFNRLVELSCGVDERPSTPPPYNPTPAETQAIAQPIANHIRMPELERRTGMSRATIYRRIEQGRFPEKIPMDGNISAWREKRCGRMVGQSAVMALSRP